MSHKQPSTSKPKSHLHRQPPNTSKITYKKQSLPSQSFIGTQKSSQLSLNHSNLLNRLLNLQLELVTKVNQLKKQKIGILEQYNSEYDKFTQLSLQMERQRQQCKNGEIDSKMDRVELIQHLQGNIDQDEQDKLKRLLKQLYQNQQNNDYQESLLNANQLQQLSQMLKVQQRTQHVIKSRSRDSVIFDNQNSILGNVLANKLESQGIITQQILFFDGIIARVLSDKLTSLQSRHKIKSTCQEGSIKAVNQMVRKRLFLENQLQKMDQILKQMSYEYQKQKVNKQQQKNSGERDKSNPIQNINISSQPSKRWQKILRYQQLKQQVNIYENEIQSNKQKNKLNITQKQQPQDPRQKQDSLTQLKNLSEVAQVHQLQQIIRNYEMQMQGQNKDKAQLYGQIEQGNRQFLQLKRQNQILRKIVKLIK